MKLEREIERWALVEPPAIAQSSYAAIMFLVSDAKKDIAALASTLAAKDAEIERLRECRDLVADWIVEGTGDLPDDTPVTIKIGNRSVILDELKNLRAALNPETSNG